MKNFQVQIETHTLSAMVGLFLEYAYEYKDREINDVHDLMSFISEQEDVEIDIIREDTLTQQTIRLK